MISISFLNEYVTALPEEFKIFFVRYESSQGQVGGGGWVLTVMSSSVRFNGFVQVSTKGGSEQWDKAKPYSLKKPKALGVTDVAEVKSEDSAKKPSVLSTKNLITKVNNLGDVQFQYFSEGNMEFSYRWSFVFVASVTTAVMNFSNFVAVASGVSFLVVLCTQLSPCLLHFQSSKMM